jgi:hypothetical protein
MRTLCAIGLSLALSSVAWATHHLSVAKTDACEVVLGKTYESIEKLECGMAPEGVALCR